MTTFYCLLQRKSQLCAKYINNCRNTKYLYVGLYRIVANPNDLRQEQVYLWLSRGILNPIQDLWRQQVFAGKHTDVNFFNRWLLGGTSTPILTKNNDHGNEFDHFHIRFSVIVTVACEPMATRICLASERLSWRREFAAAERCSPTTTVNDT